MHFSAAACGSLQFMWWQTSLPLHWNLRHALLGDNGAGTLARVSHSALNDITVQGLRCGRSSPRVVPQGVRGPVGARIPALPVSGHSLVVLLALPG